MTVTLTMDQSTRQRWVHMYGTGVLSTPSIPKIIQKAKGDVKKRDKPDPYAYVPLSRQKLNRRKAGGQTEKPVLWDFTKGQESWLQGEEREPNRIHHFTITKLFVCFFVTKKSVICFY